MTKPTIAAALIVKNEEAHLKTCLESVYKWVDEIVILDSGSSDQTESIARQYTDRFYTSSDWPGFGIQRQRAQSFVRSDFVLWLDADEIVTDELRQSIQENIARHSPGNLYQVDRLSSAFGKQIKHSGWSPDWLIRLYKTADTQYNAALVHESVIIPDGAKIVKLKGHLLHHTYDSLHHYINKTTGYLKAWTDQREGKKKAGLSTALLHALSCFLKMYIIKRGFLDGKHGFILAWLATHSTFVKYIDLYLRSEMKK